VVCNQKHITAFHIDLSAAVQENQIKILIGQIITELVSAAAYILESVSGCHVQTNRNGNHIAEVKSPFAAFLGTHIRNCARWYTRFFTEAFSCSMLDLLDVLPNEFYRLAPIAFGNRQTFRFGKRDWYFILIFL
jgi:hypothetical protein